MIHEGSLDAVAAAQFNEHFARPLYTTFGFAQIPQFVREQLGVGAQQTTPFAVPDAGAAYDRVVLFFVDAFGWRFFEQYQDRSPFLRRIVDEGVAHKLTSQFPSTTAAHVTTIHSGMPVGQHGVFEWFYYEPQLDAIIAPLLFSFAGDKERETLAPLRADPARLFPTETLYQDLGRHGVDSFVVQHSSYAASPFTRTVTAGARAVPYRTVPQALTLLAQLFAQQQRPSYYFVYIDSIDTICHQHGPDSPHAAAEIETFLFMMEHLFQRNTARAPGRTLLLLTADHGQTAVDPATTIYLNQRFPEIQAYLKTNAAGQPLVPAGSCRDVFLYVKDERLDEAQALLTSGLAGRAAVYRTADLIAQGLFGSAPPSDTFLSRVGNLVILPYAGESVWWYEKDVYEQRLYGMHGGLTRAELETILLVQSYGR